MDAIDDDNLRQTTNFGGNQSWYARCYAPACEADILDILRHNRGATIRVLGSGHSWSNIAANSDIALDMSAFDSVMSVDAGGDILVRVGAGCTIQHLLDRLHAATDRTLPTLGAIKKQTISGAISTGTHGSGRSSLSHYVASLRAIVFEASTGDPVVCEFADGPALQAARCGLGCAGIILSLDLRTVPKYLVSETVRAGESVEEIIPLFAENPLTNFTLSPYGWALSVFTRKPLEQRPLGLLAKFKARAFRFYNLVLLDFLFHVGVIASLVAGRWAIKAFQTCAPYTLLKNRVRIDDSEHVLTSCNDLFCHEEMELCVSESSLPMAMRFIRASIEHFADIKVAFPSEFSAAIGDAGLEEAFAAGRGSYVHHYPVFCRRVLPDDTLISLTASASEPMYTISIFSYAWPGHRAAYYLFCRFLAHGLRQLVNARLHWGKHFPFEYGDIAPLYPRLEEFRAFCMAHDRNGVLRNGYTARVLKLPPGRSSP